jgi:hypothetical protein
MQAHAGPRFPLPACRFPHARKEVAVKNEENRSASERFPAVFLLLQIDPTRFSKTRLSLKLKPIAVFPYLSTFPTQTTTTTA